MNKYEVLGIVGEGAYGTVLKVRSHVCHVLAFDMRCALKFCVTHVVVSTRILSFLVSTAVPHSCRCCGRFDCNSAATRCVFIMIYRR
jgi:hypothetical protein